MLLTRMSSLSIFPRDKIVKKQFLLSLFLILTVLSSSAQSKYRGFAEAGYGAFAGEKAGSGYMISTSHGVLFNHIFIGGGIGVGFEDIKNPDYDPDYVLPEGHDGMGYFGDVKRFTGVSVPLFLNVKGLWEKQRISPVLDFKAGTSLGFITGLFGEVGGGFRFSLHDRNAIMVDAFCKYAFEPSGMVTDDSDYMEGEFFNVGLKVAYEF